MPRYHINLAREEVDKLTEITRTGVNTSKSFKYSRALLLLDEGELGHRWSQDAVAIAVGMSTRSIINLKKRFVEGCLEFVMKRNKQEKPSRPIVFDSKFEAHLLQLLHSEPPQGYKRWTVRLLAQKLVELKIIKSVSTMTVQRVLRNMNISLT